MSQAPKSGREVEDHHVHNASSFLTQVLGIVRDNSDEEES